MNVKKLFIDYFKSKGHVEYSSSPLIPNNDKSLLFVNSGMVQFKDIFLGNVKPKDKAIVSCQKCMRAGGKHNDLDNIGFTTRHHSFFEMLGNFSFGDYFKENAIEYAWDFLINNLSLDAEKLYVSVHESDEESKNIWIDKIKINPNKVLVLGDDDNFWQMGETGPCGPCSEIYYDLGDKYDGVLPTEGDPKDRYIEIWNLVFTQYNKTSSDNLEELPQKCVDTGMGLERIQAIVEGLSDNYDSSIFYELNKFINSRIKLTGNSKYVKKILLDHIRACCHLINDNVIPDREGRGYVLRRILRRSSRFLYKHNIKDPFLFECSEVICNTSSDFPDLKTNINKISETIKTEEIKYLKTLGKGIDMIDAHLKNNSTLDADTIFTLYDTYGFPYEITEEIALENKISLDKQGYEKLMLAQKEKARGSKSFKEKSILKLDTNHETSFIGYSKNNQKAKVLAMYHENNEVKEASSINNNYSVILSDTCLYPEGGGQISDIGKISLADSKFNVVDVQRINNIIIHKCILVSGEFHVNDNVVSSYDAVHRKKVTCNHSSTHLLHHYLRNILGEHVQQRGSSVSQTGFRFDFTHNKPLSENEIDNIEQSINSEIDKSYVSKSKIVSYDKAIKSGALAFFDEKYDSDVRVVSIGKNSVELCGGTHVESTSEIGAFKIINQSSVANGVRRIECVTGPCVVNYLNQNISILNKICKEFQATADNVINKINLLKKNNKDLKDKNILYSKDYLTNLFLTYQPIKIKNKISLFIEELDNIDSNEVKLLSDIIKSNTSECISFFITSFDNSIYCYISVSKNILSSYNAKQLSKTVNDKFSGKGGGSDTFSTCILNDINTVDLKDYLKEITQ
jgi:alanyl-tRNA synthetase